MPYGDTKTPSSDHHDFRRGPSSFQIQASQRIFKGLGLAKGHRFLDLGCGPGDYALAAAKIVGADGFVCAVDLWETMVKNLEKEVRDLGSANIRAVIADIIAGLPFAGNTMDRALLASVLHMPGPTRNLLPIGAEIRRVLRPGGRLAILEHQVKNFHPDRPVHLRLSPERIEKQMARSGFRKAGRIDLEFSYLLLFQ